MTARELRKRFIDFFVEKGHKEIPSSSLLPENDPTTLFISAGMHPLVPYLLGEPHPLGKRLVSIQKCLRTIDIDCVGDIRHQTFFEMMGNWSLGDYWKEEIIPWNIYFLTKILRIPMEKIFVTCFAGDGNAPKDEESAAIWEKAGIPKERIYFLGKKDNWWGPVGLTGPCGPDSEMYYDTGEKACSKNCRPGCNCGKYLEFWNDVFMQYYKTDKGTFEPLKQKNIDTGMGVERTLMVLNSINDAYKLDVLWPIIQKIEEISGKNYEQQENQKSIRIIADHLRAATFLIADGVSPGNTEQGYILRRLTRRAIRHGHLLGIEKPFVKTVIVSVIETMGEAYPEIVQNKERIFAQVQLEEERFFQTLKQGEKEFGKLFSKGILSGKDAFFLFETYGFPFELTQEMALEKGISVEEKEFNKAFEEHQQISRAGAEKKFAGGLADHSEIATRYHTATHLLQAALRQVLESSVQQVGSNITSERMRFDFTYGEKLTSEQIKKIEEIVSEKIKEDLPVTMETMTLAEAKEKGANAFFEQKYGDLVKVYSIGSFSIEVCGGPHVLSTKDIKSFKIIKEESCGSGRRRIYAVI